jgi:hypothetical protein
VLPKPQAVRPGVFQADGIRQVLKLALPDLFFWDIYLNNITA